MIRPLTLHVIDVETTGLDPEKDRVVEIAVVPVSVDDRVDVRAGARSFVNPHCPIPPEASAIHHIIDADVVDAPDLGDALGLVLFPSSVESVEIAVGHNCRFDRSFIPALHVCKWIDTYRCALHVWPDAPAFGNQALRYWLWLDLPRSRGVDHTALSDATVTAHILARLIAERSIDDLLKLSTKAVVLKKVGFGTHFGSLWADVPTSYLEWALKQDFEPDVRFTVRTELARRKNEGSAHAD